MEYLKKKNEERNGLRRRRRRRRHTDAMNVNPILNIFNM